MKKLIISLLLVASISGLYAQKSNVNRAKNKVLIETPEFGEARELIKPALTDESTKNVANTWYVAGLIDYKENQTLGDNPDQDKRGPMVLQSYNYFLKADSLDQLPDAKGKVKPKHRKDIKNMVTEYYQYYLIGYGAHLFDNRQYKDAYNVFETFLEIPDLPLIENSIQKDTTYNMIEYYAAISASNADMSKEAIGFLEKLKDGAYEPITVNQMLYDEYRKLNDTVNYVRVLENAVQKFPQEPWFLQNLINHYIYSNQTEKALDYLETAIKQEPNSAQYRFVEGSLKESLKDTEGALASYKKATELDPNMHSAYAEMGRIHYNKAIALWDAADAIRGNAKKMKEEQAKAMEEFKEALPYYQKANQLAPNEMNYKVMMRTLYYRLKMYTEYEAIDAEIKKITGDN